MVSSPQCVQKDFRIARSSQGPLKKLSRSASTEEKSPAEAGARAGLGAKHLINVRIGNGGNLIRPMVNAKLIDMVSGS
jgi:hypothetical protein